MRLTFFFTISLLFYGCWSNNDDGRFPYKNISIPITKVKLYRSIITINDTLSFTGVYLQKEGTFDNKDEEYLEGNLHVRDTIITDNNPKDYVIRRRNRVDTKFYRWPLNKK